VYVTLGQTGIAAMSQILRLVTYNLQRGIHYDHIRRHLATLPSLREADVIAVQEALVPVGGTNTLARLAADLDGEYRWTYRTVMSYPDKEYGNGFLFRPTVTPELGLSVPLPRVERLGWMARLKTEGGVPDTKSAYVQVFNTGGRRLRLVSLHLDFAGGADHRVRQLSHLLQVLEQRALSDAAVADVLCGDFNTSGYYRSVIAQKATRRVLDVARVHGFADWSGSVPWTSDLFSSVDPADPARRLLQIGQAIGLRYRQKLDHVLGKGVRPSGPAIRARVTGRDYLPGSDHLPLVVDLVL
ncbi:uncharacterized protein METZ01_LOCUS69622, partial [marine metagenome]